MKKRLTLRNSFHETKITVISDEASPVAAWDEINMEAMVEWNRGMYGSARRKLNRITKALCGISECCCGTFRDFDNE